MKLSQGQKILIGILTLLPFLIGPYVFFQIFSFIMTAASQDNFEPEPASILSAVFSFIFPIILISIISLGLFIFYIIHAINTKTMDTTERLIWILLFIFVGIIVFPIYWFLRIWNEPKS